MGKPAVGYQGMTAGKKTQKKSKRWIAAIASAMAAVIFIQTPVWSAKSLFERVTKTVVVSRKIPFETTYIDLPNQYKGYTELVSEGVMGEKIIEAQVVYEGQQAVQVTSLKATDAAQPINRVVKRGTKVLRSRTADGSVWKVSFRHPLKNRGWLSADFYDYPGHNGIDYAAPYGTPVYASAEGKVTLARWYGEYGWCVILQHADGVETLYAHNSRLLVRVGQTVKQGEKIAEVGSTGNSTGNHLHFELRVNGKFYDPLIYIDQ